MRIAYEIDVNLPETFEILATPENESQYTFLSETLQSVSDARALLDEKMCSNSYRSKAIQKKAQVSAIQIGHWTKIGVIIPAVAVRGTGKMHVYDQQNLIEAMICRQLSQYSINYGVMREVLDFLRKKQWLFHVRISPLYMLRGKENNDDANLAYFKATKDIKRRLTIWEYFKFYPVSNGFYLLLWKHSEHFGAEIPTQGVFNMHIASDAYRIEEEKLPTDIFSRFMESCEGAIVINLTLILGIAGPFYKEREN